jgi:hypothetical protein
MEDNFLVTGEWEGFYVYSFDNGKHKMNCQLSFKNGTINGSGIDDVANYKWQGNYNLETYTVVMHKKYSTHEVKYEGHADENGIWGKWNLETMAGGSYLAKEKRHKRRKIAIKGRD